MWLSSQSFSSVPERRHWGEFRIVYFPSVPETTGTNGILSRVGQEAVPSMYAPLVTRNV